jgi:hypothetical protein
VSSVDVWREKMKVRILMLAILASFVFTSFASADAGCDQLVRKSILNGIGYDDAGTLDFAVYLLDEIGVPLTASCVVRNSPIVATNTVNECQSGDLNFFIARYRAAFHSCSELMAREFPESVLKSMWE